MSINNGPDILDRLKVRASIGKLGVKYTFNEEDFKFSFAGYTDGPVRVLWRADNYWSLGPLGKIPIPSMATFYDEYAVLDNPMDTRLNPALFGLDLTVVISHDLALDKKRDYSVCTNVNPECNSLRDPNMATIARSLVEKDMKWGGVKGPEGALITHFAPDRGLNVRVIGSFRYDDSYNDHPEYIAGSSPLLGFKLVNWKNVKSAIYNLKFIHYFMKSYSVKEFERFDRVATNPLEVFIK